MQAVASNGLENIHASGAVKVPLGRRHNLEMKEVVDVLAVKDSAALLGRQVDDACVVAVLLRLFAERFFLRSTRGPGLQKQGHYRPGKIEAHSNNSNA